MVFNYRLIILLLLISSTCWGQSLNPKPSPASQGGVNTLSTFNGGLQSNVYFRPPRLFNNWVQQDSGGMFWFDSATTKTMWYHNGTTRVQMGSGGGGSYTAGGWLGLSGSVFYFDTANKKATSLTNADNFHFITPLAVLNANNTLYSQLSGMIDSVAYLDSVRLADTSLNLRAVFAADLAGYVPYTGATQTLNLGTQNLITDTITGTGSGGLHLHGSASNSGIEIANFGQVRMDQYPITNSGDSVLTTNAQGYIQVYNLKGNYVPYTGAISNLNMGNNSITAKRLNVDTLEPNSSAGLHLHNTSHQDIFIAGAGGGQNLTIYAPTNFSLMANQNETDTVLGSTSSGLIKKIGIATTYLKKSDTVSLSDRINAKGNGTVTSVGSGFGLSGGTITTTGTLRVDSTNVPTQYRVDTTAFNALTRINTKGSGTVTSIQVVGGTGATVTPTTAVTTSGVYTVTPEVSSATFNSLSNKRWVPRVISAASYTTSVTIPADSVDLFQITAQAGALLFNAPSGTPNNGDLLVIRIKDNGTARALTYNAIFNWSPPSTTVLGKYLVMCFMYNSVTSNWNFMWKRDEP
jgi:hypothetical protein